MVYDVKIRAFVFSMGVLACTAASISGGSQNPVDANSCMRNCPVTADYRPFCGTDGNSYPTNSMLHCFQKCGIAVQKAHDGNCNGQQITVTLNIPTPATPTSPNPIFEDICVKNCPFTHEHKPLCGNDGREYPNLSYITCFQNCGKPIQKAYDGNCKTQQSTTVSPTTPNPIFEDPCVKKCPFTYDLNPFCGTDGQDYPNLSFLRCFQSCGKPIQKASDGYCNGQQLFTVVPNFSQSTASSTTSNPIFEDPCVKNCPTTYDYRPICGSDGKDYANPSFITCFQNCGKPIQKAHDGYCNGQQPFTVIPIFTQSAAKPKSSNPILEDPCVKNCPITYDYRPICGSDGKDYANPSFITCFQNCNKQITKAHDGKCNNKN